VSKLGEEGKVAVRNVRRDAMKTIEKLEKDGSISGAAAASRVWTSGGGGGGGRCRGGGGGALPWSQCHPMQSPYGAVLLAAQAWASVSLACAHALHVHAGLRACRGPA
jgi:hypothetical protein